MTMRRITGHRRTVVCAGDPGVVGERHADPFDLETLLALARHQPDGEFGVEMVDLLAAIGLAHDAEVVLFTNAIGGQLAVPIRVLMHGGRVVLGAIGDRLRSPNSMSPRLELAGWTETDEPFRPVSMSACTFQEFVQSQ